MNTERLYGAILDHHLEHYRQMVFVSGPRQVGKTTLCRGRSGLYLDWDNEDHRTVILAGPGAVARLAGLESLTAQAPVITFDELHRYRRWRSFLKGFFDTYEQQARVLVTGSSRLDQYKRGGDSLMGRYFPLRVHPFSVAELVSPALPTDARTRTGRTRRRTLASAVGSWRFSRTVHAPLQFIHHQVA